MKRLITFVLIIVFAFAVVSCAVQTTPEATTYNYYTSKITPIATTATETASTSATASVSSETASTEVTGMPEVTTAATAASTIDPLTLPTVGEYTSLREQMKIKQLQELPPNARLDEDYPFLAATTKPLRSASESQRHKKTDFLIVTVLGYEYLEYVPGNYYDVYYVNVEQYGMGNTDPTVYMMRYHSPKEPIYGQNMLEIGERYLTISSAFKKNQGGIFNSMGIATPVVVQNGELYVYNSQYFRDTPKLKCAIKITDETENLIYKPGRDDDVIEFMKKKNMPVPTYNYKFKLDEFVNEVCDYTIYEIKNITPIGEYTSIKEQVPFESFAELPIDMRKDINNPYIINKKKNIIEESKRFLWRDFVTVAIAGYIGEEIGDDGMVYSYYYVYADIYPLSYGMGNTKYFFDDTVYVMKAYGSPAHPYYGQKRYEIGDVLLRFETDLDALRKGEMLDATSMFLIDESHDDFFLDFAYPDFNFDFDTSVMSKVPISNDYFDFYKEKEEGDIIEYMNEKTIELPKFKRGFLYNYYAIMCILCKAYGWNK